MSSGVGCMQSERENAERLKQQFESFASEMYGRNLSNVEEDPHFLAFLEHCVERQTTFYMAGRISERPIRAMLQQRVLELGKLLQKTRSRFRISNKAIAYAQTLSDRYATIRKGARAATPEQILLLLSRVDQKTPYGKRMRAAILLLCETWCRPSEIFRRTYPDDVCADYDHGIVITVPRSKTQPGPEPEYFTIPHCTNRQLCAACALHEFVKWLGPTYCGPLFPTITIGETKPTGNFWTTAQFHTALKTLQRQSGCEGWGLSGNSFRKAGATNAAANNDPLSEIQEGLRHDSFAYSGHYIDMDVLFERMRSPLG
jgi:integrase